MMIFFFNVMDIEAYLSDFESDLAQLDQYGHNDGSIVLVGGRGFEYGNDQNEIIIDDAVVLWVRK